MQINLEMLQKRTFVKALKTKKIDEVKLNIARLFTVKRDRAVLFDQHHLAPKERTPTPLEGRKTDH